MNINYKECVDYIKSKISCTPQIAIILGSGLGNWANEITDATVIPYSDIPNFPTSTAPGHKGNFIVGKLSGKDVIAMQGRFHYYEGYSLQQVTLPVRIFSLLNVDTLFVTNAAGGINFDYTTGDVMIIKDHIGMMPNPLIGPNDSDFGVRFPDMSNAYDRELRKLARQIAEEQGVDIKEGVYINVTGPSFETVAEVNFFRMVGADAVGMSTVPEVIVARHCGMRVFGMSVITNEATNDTAESVYDEQSVLIEADKAATKVMNIVKTMISRIK